MTCRHVAVIGAGGNIGSHLIPHLARLPQLGSMLLVDPDVYKAANLSGQDISLADVGKPKAEVQARRARQINPPLRVLVETAGVEEVPRGRLRGDVILSCVDSRRARQAINEVAWRLGVSWLDAGVLGDQMLARVSGYWPGDQSPCLECAWSEQDYAQLEQEYPCNGGPHEARPTRAPSPLGALAAALLAIECHKVLEGDMSRAVFSRQITIDASSHRLLVTAFRRYSACRFDHRIWSIEPWPLHVNEATAADLLRLGGSVRIAGHHFVRKLTCGNCGAVREVLELERAPRRATRRCPKCGAPSVAMGFDVSERLQGPLPPELASLTLERIGLKAGDIIQAGEKFYELSGAE
jgi:molybdopterin/thiamine biosynthesis adenylyltransferase